MCGIFAVFSSSRRPFSCLKCKGKIRKSFREIIYDQCGKQRHRGPDHTGIEIIEESGVGMAHERLAIVGVHTGDQPFKSDSERLLMVANGEIYNYLEISQKIREQRGSYKPKSDSSVLMELYEEHGTDLFEHITGMYTFVLYNRQDRKILMARDPYGIIPMYIGWDEEGNVWVASEMKCLVEVCSRLEVFEPGTMRFGTVDKLEEKRFFNPLWFERSLHNPTNLKHIRETLESAVHSHLGCEVKFGALLSGGVDSSLIASIATRVVRETVPGYKLRTFSVGLKGAPDFKYAKKVADFIGSIHTEVHFTVEEGLDCIRDVIYKLETYDISTVRCSIPMYITTRYIKNQGIKMILSGEGADEIFGGYLYFHKAPTADDFHEELVKRLRELHLSDCLRANKTTMAWGVELRVPFLDKDFVDLVMSTEPGEKMPGPHNTYQPGDEKEGVESSRKRKETSTIEKYILRKAFDDDSYLPKDVLWRQKEQFSDGVGYSFIDTLKEYTASHVSDEEFASAAKLFPINTPTTKEAFYYRSIFEEMFPGNHCASTVKKWVPRTDWGCSDDPCGRKQAVHKAHA